MLWGWRKKHLKSIINIRTKNDILLFSGKIRMGQYGTREDGALNGEKAVTKKSAHVIERLPSTEKSSQIPAKLCPSLSPTEEGKIVFSSEGVAMEPTSG